MMSIDPGANTALVENVLESNELLAFDATQAIALYQIGRMITTRADLQATLEAVTQATHDLSGAYTTALALLEYEGSLIISAGRGPVNGSVEQPMTTDRGVAAEALLERRPVLVADLLAEPDRAPPELDTTCGIRTLLAVPLMWHTEAMGVVCVTFTTPNALGLKDIALISALADQAAAAVGHARDATHEERLRLESDEIARQFAEQANQLERFQQQLIQNEKLSAIGQLVHGLAHEMNTPLSVVITNLSVLSRHAENLGAIAQLAMDLLPALLDESAIATQAAPLDAAVQGADLEYTLEDLPDLLNETIAAAQRVAELVRSMANFARRDPGGPSVVAIQDVIEAGLTLASNPLKQYAQMVREYVPTPPVLGLPSELSELFLRLFINAAQALEEGPGTVTVSTSHESGSVVVRIRDTGRGISAINLARVFDPFFTTRAAGGGTGMGLAVCYGIVARHGGSIGLESEPGTGTTVTVSLPMADGGEAAA
jgi:signal transduction histidine kinase